MNKGNLFNKANLPTALYELLVVIINRGKGEAVVEYLRSLAINLSIISFGDGTAPTSLQNILNFNQEKEVVITLVNAAQSEQVLDLIEQEFLSVENYAGIAFTIPLKSITDDALTKIKGVNK